MATERRRNAPKLRKIAREALGFDNLRPGQQEAIQSILDGRDTLALMPTGSGKSAIYQIAGMMIEGATVVVSPLIALQRDQVETINEQEIGGAALLNSTLSASARRDTLKALEQSELEFLFLAPEQLANPDVLERLRLARPSLFVIDEAHCLSDWGHDFRPDYMRLGAVIEALDHPPVLALTATASPPVREEIITRLGMRDANVVVQGFDRPNISLGVEKFHDEDDKRRALVERVIEAQKPGIIYTATRRHSEEIAQVLSQAGVKARAYHAGLRSRERNEIQSAFMDDAVEVIVATTAFGMGIDKPNVRFVFHYDISDSVDSYYQEIGRAGRDGQPARALLFYNPSDLGIRRFFAGSGQIDGEQIEQVAELIYAHKGPMDVQLIREATELSATPLMAALRRLADLGIIELLPNGEVVARTRPSDLAAAAEQAMLANERRQQYERSRLEMIRRYAELRDCRRAHLLSYFGELIDGPCDKCDNCEAGVVAQRNEQAEPFRVGARVQHNGWGGGQVLRYEGEKLVVLFDNVGYKTLATDLVVERGLLHPESV